MLGLLIAAFLAGAPFLGQAVGHWTYSASMREVRAQQAVLREVPAILLQEASDWSGFGNSPGAVPEVSARWRAPDGRPRTGKLLIPDGAPAGSTVMVWIDRAGRLVAPPLEQNQVVTRAQLTGGLAVGGLAVLLIVAGWLARQVLDQRRMAAWDADWLATGPRWRPRR